MNEARQQQQKMLVEYPPGSHQYTLPKNLLLTRGFSKVQANEEILNETRNQIESNLKRGKDDSTLHITDLSDYSFMLPDLTKYPEEFRDFLQQDLIEITALMSLSEAGHLNWWATNAWDGACRLLQPMVTSGDGNCLLHAASLAMWGLHDRYLILRKALHSTLEDIKPNSPLWRRWKWEQMKQNRKFGLVLNEDEWSKEWSGLLRLSSYQPRNNNNNKQQSNSSSSSNLQMKVSNGSTTTESSNQAAKNSSSNSSANSSEDGVYFESLEEFHVFVLANIIQRPIIIVSDTVLHDANGEPLAPIPFGGIYLPLECDINKCYRYPLILTYDSAHFSALVLMEDDNSTINESEPPYPIIPITYSNLELLPIHFSYDPGSNFDWSKCQQLFNDDTNGSSNTRMNPLARKQSSNSNIKDMELTRDMKMFMLQNYLNLVKIQLINQNCVSLIDIQVEQKLKSSASSVSASLQSTNTINGKKFNKSNSTLKKFLNIFRRDSSSNHHGNNDMSLVDGRDRDKNINLRHYHQQDVFSNTHHTTTTNSNTLNSHKKKYVFKSWNALFETLNSDSCILASRLSLEKPQKYDKIVENYIKSARNKFDMIKREQQLSIQQEQASNNIPPAEQQQNAATAATFKRCSFCRNSTDTNEICKNCSYKNSSYQSEMITHH